MFLACTARELCAIICHFVDFGLLDVIFWNLVPRRLMWCLWGWCRWTGVSILLFSARRRYTLVPRRLPLSWGLVSMDRSVHPPVFRAEAVHSCAASVAVVLGVGIDGGVFILLFLERRRYTLVPRRLPLSWGLVSMEECLFSDCTNAFTFSRFEDLVAVPHV